MRKLLVMTLLVAALGPGHAGAAAPGSLMHHSYTQPGGLTCGYWLYVPAGLTLPAGLPHPGSGDACVHTNSFLCAGGILGLSDYPVTVQTWHDTRRRDVLEMWVVHGLAHAQPHAPSGEPYTDPLGPDVTTASYHFFLKHHLT